MYVGQWHDYFVEGSVEERTFLMSICRIPTILSHTTVHAVEGKHERHPVLQLIPLQCDEHVHMLRKKVHKYMFTCM